MTDEPCKVKLKTREKKKIKKQNFFYYDAGLDRPKLFSDLDEPDGATYRVEHLEYNSRRYIQVVVHKAGTKQPPDGSRSIYIPVTIAAQIADLIKEKLPTYTALPKKSESSVGYFILATKSKAPCRFLVYSDMMFTSLREAAAYVPNENASTDWKIFKITFNKACFTTEHDKHTFTKVLSSVYKAGWSGGRWRKPKLPALPELE
jgi:hypothetical protein